MTERVQCLNRHRKRSVAVTALIKRRQANGYARERVPIEVRLFRRVVKRWGCLFRCLTTGAILHERAYALDEDAFLCAYGNFKARRGTPKVMRSDKETNFKGAQRELTEALERIDSSKIYNSFALEGMEWIFNPPAALHFGGVWERFVQSVKRALDSVLHLQDFTD